MAICKKCKQVFDTLQLKNIEYVLEFEKTGECQKCMEKRLKKILR